MAAVGCCDDETVGNLMLNGDVPFVGAERTENFPVCVATKNLHTRFLSGIQNSVDLSQGDWTDYHAANQRTLTTKSRRKWMIGEDPGVL
jgi:hypothetical protein